MKSRLWRCTLRRHVDVHVDGGRGRCAPAHPVEAGGSRPTPARLTPRASRALRRPAAQADADPCPRRLGEVDAARRLACTRERDTAVRLGRARQRRQRPGPVLDLRHPCASHTRPERRRGLSSHAARSAGQRRRRRSPGALQRAHGVTAPGRARAGGLPPGRQPGDRRGSFILPRAPSPDPRARALEPFRAGAPARAPARPRRAGRDRRAAASLLRRGGRPLSQRPPRARARPWGRDPATRAHGGMGGRSLPRDAHHPRPGERARVHRGVCGRQPPRRRLPELGGAGRPPRGDEGLPAPDVGAPTPLRSPLRRRHRPTRLDANAARARAFELLPHPPRREARVVLLPPALSASYCATSSRSPSRSTLARCIAGRAPGTESTATRPRRFITPRRQGTSPMPPS